MHFDSTLRFLQIWSFLMIVHIAQEIKRPVMAPKSIKRTICIGSVSWSFSLEEMQEGCVTGEGVVVVGAIAIGNSIDVIDAECTSD